MLVHTVIFRTRSKEKLEHFNEGLQTLRNIGGVEFMHIGKPVPSARPVVDDFLILPCAWLLRTTKPA